MAKTGSNFFTLISSSAAVRKGKLNCSSMEISTPCLLIRTSRFLPHHLTPDNLDLTLPNDSSVLEMNIDYLCENEAILKECPLSLAELAGVAGSRAVCLTTRVHSSAENGFNSVINGDDFISVQNISGVSRFELATVSDLLKRFRPDFLISPFDEHAIPATLKRSRRAVDRTLKYGAKISSECERLEIPFVSAVIGSEYATERNRMLSGKSEYSSGYAFSDLHRLCKEDRLEQIKSCEIGLDSMRILRGSTSPADVIDLLPFIDMLDTTFVDDLTAKGCVLQLPIASESVKCPETARAALLSSEPLNLWDECYFDDHSPVQAGCSCACCTNYRRSYVHHLLKSHEMLAGVLMMMHNLHQYHRWIELLRRF